MEMIIDVLADALADCLKMLPFLFAAFLLIEGLEHYSTKLTRKALEDVDKAGPVVGALVGCVPQCGFSVMASNLYAGGIISVGTLLSVFLATSDEAVLILLGNPDQGKTVLTLLAVKDVYKRQDKAYAEGGIEVVDELVDYLKSDAIHFDRYDHKNRFAD